MKKELKRIKISMGIWGNTNLRDRFNPDGFKNEVSVIDRIEEVASIKGIEGIELHYPTEIHEENYKEVEKVLTNCGLRIVQLCGHTWVDKEYRFGALGCPDRKIRNKAIERVETALDMADYFKAPISVLWPACSGSDFALQTDYFKMYDDYLSSVKTLLEYIHIKKYITKLAIEPKPFEPRSYILAGTTGQALTLVNEVNDSHFGINYDLGHSLIAKENVDDQLALILRHNRLFHTHFNDNDQQCDADLPPGTVNFIRLVKVLFVLAGANYQGWHGLDLFPFRDEAVQFIKESRNNLILGYAVVDELKKAGLDKMQTDCQKGPEISQLILKSIMSGAAYERARSLYTENEWGLHG